MNKSCFSMAHARVPDKRHRIYFCTFGMDFRLAKNAIDSDVFLQYVPRSFWIKFKLIDWCHKTTESGRRHPPHKQQTSPCSSSRKGSVNLRNSTSLSRENNFFKTAHNFVREWHDRHLVSHGLQLDWGQLLIATNTSTAFTNPAAN